MPSYPLIEDEANAAIAPKNAVAFDVAHRLLLDLFGELIALLDLARRATDGRRAAAIIPQTHHGRLSLRAGEHYRFTPHTADPRTILIICSTR